MSEEFSITETASKLNVTRQYIYKKLIELDEELKPHIVFKNNVKYLKLEGIEILKKNIKGKTNIKKVNDSLKNEINEDNSTLTFIIDNYEKQIEYLKEELAKKDSFYNKRIQHFEDESKEKNKLLENMQVLLKDLKEEKLLIEEKNKKKKWWHFKK
jgi:hypothetical protein